MVAGCPLLSISEISLFCLEDTASFIFVPTISPTWVCHVLPKWSICSSPDPSRSEVPRMSSKAVLSATVWLCRGLFLWTFEADLTKMCQESLQCYGSHSLIPWTCQLFQVCCHWFIYSPETLWITGLEINNTLCLHQVDSERLVNLHRFTKFLSSSCCRLLFFQVLMWQQ